ncbi:PD-(D/E)XK nuclease family protein [Deinococcus frigens]
MLMAAPFAPMSPSVAETYQLCPHKELLSHFYVESEFNENLHKGQALHSTVRDAARKFQVGGNWPDMDELVPMLRSHLSKLPSGEEQSGQSETLAERVDRWLSELLECLGGFLLFAEGKVFPGGVVSAEEWVCLDLDHPAGKVRATGRIDLLLRVNGELWVVDIKTGKVPESYEVTSPLALALYVAAMREAHPGQTVRAYEVYPAGDTLLEYDTDNVDADLGKLVALGQHHFVETEWPKHTGNHCNWCDHYRRCMGLDEAAAD